MEPNLLFKQLNEVAGAIRPILILYLANFNLYDKRKAQSKAV